MALHILVRTLPDYCSTKSLKTTHLACIFGTNNRNTKSGVPYNNILDITKYFTIMHHQMLLNSWPHKSWWHHFWTTPGLIWPLFSIYDDDLSFWSKHTQYSLIAIQKICTSRFFLDKSLGLIWIFQHSRPNSRINQQRHPHFSDSSDSLFYSWSDYN